MVKKEVNGAAQKGTRTYRQSQPHMHDRTKQEFAANLIAKQKKQLAGPMT
jgi:hypothetical protein